jgi:hypothetical protein
MYIRLTALLDSEASATRIFGTRILYVNCFRSLVPVGFAVAGGNFFLLYLFDYAD